MFEPVDGQMQQDPVPQGFTSSVPDDSKSGLATAAFVLGIIACSLNILLITAPIGLIFSLVAFILGLIVYIQQKLYAGLVLSLISFLVLMIWIISFLVIIWKDPTLFLNL